MLKLRVWALKRFFAYFFLIAIAYFVSGCATAPLREGVATYSLHGTTYLSLIQLCQSRNIGWEYDAVTKVVQLRKGSDSLSLKVGETLVLVNNAPQHLKTPVDLYQGTIVVPAKFRDQILDNLFKKQYTQYAVPSVSKIKKIVIDAGHGGTDPGAIGRTGLREKDVTLDIARRLGAILKTKGFDIAFTRSVDKTLSLERRVSIANNARADLFISVHANANRVRSLKGFEVYYIAVQGNDYRRAVAAAEAAIPNVDSSCFYQLSPNVKAIVWDMIYTSNRAESVELANFICRNVNDTLDTRLLGIKTANFYVLKGARTPAILVEVGFISNYEEERMIKNSYYRQQIASCLAEGILDYALKQPFLEAQRR